jgi:hypothetical protein
MHMRRRVEDACGTPDVVGQANLPRFGYFDIRVHHLVYLVWPPLFIKHGRR